jgi:hypothetical protein
VSTAALLVAAIFAGCSAGQPAATTPAATTSPAATSPSSASSTPDLTPVPNGSTAETSGPASQPTQTDTDWGRIWDAVPDWFPVPPDAVPTETGEEGPASASLAAGGSAQSVAQFMQTGLTGAGFAVDASNGPAEDGSLVLDAVGPDPKCMVQVRVRPLSGTTNLIVLYGAACPFD